MTEQNTELLPLGIEALKKDFGASFDMSVTESTKNEGWNDAVTYLNNKGYLHDPSEVARLREENKRLREALEKISSTSTTASVDTEACNYYAMLVDDHKTLALKALAAAKAGES